jgi:hypothetical protein
LFDFFKILLSIDSNELINNPLLDFEGKFKRIGGEALYFPLNVNFYNLEFDIKDNEKYRYDNDKIPYRINSFLSGSCHKFMNIVNTQIEPNLYNTLEKQKKDAITHNYNDFYISDFLDFLIYNWQKFKINPFCTKINILEFGVNILLPFNAKWFIKNCVISHKWNEPNVKSFRGKGYLKEFEHQHFIIKIYAKGFQFNQNKNLLRFEIKVLKNEYFKDRGLNIKTFADLLHENILNSLVNELYKVFNELLIYDPLIDTSSLKPSQREFYKQAKNYIFWDNLKDKLILSTFNNHVERYKKITSKYSNIQNEIANLILKKGNELIHIDSKNRYKLTEWLTVWDNENKVQINTSNIGLKYTSSPVKTCKHCGTDISHTRKNRLFCNNNEKCKNDFNNPKLNPKNSLLKRIRKIENQMMLFSFDEVVKYSEHQKALLSKPNSIYN